MPDNIPTISLENNSKISGNIADFYGGGIWVPQPHLNKITAAGTVVFEKNQSVQAYFMLDSSPDVAIHQSHIFTTAFTLPPSGAPAFTYAYNNDDISYQEGIPLVTVTFDSVGGSPRILQASTKKGSSLGALIPQIPLRSGYKFLGWYTEMDGAGTQFNQNTVVNGSMTVYALWEQLPPEPHQYLLCHLSLVTIVLGI
ncbi:InlB B-repeat-containing protein [endosymbiont 'TC1' of Trimyema compressum]|uniref:InlB B-repeat-containing protein n=1 Tax=endosymbiont 'TC1' of Trimyema compressum TaxID=243899 RepID=UPI001FDEED38|nr:InlB B-repeat-containing protein [endosymbiont 'TC1' of Trimyema compressum]